MYQRKSDFSCQQHGRILIMARIWIREIVAFTESNELGSEVITWISISHGLQGIWLPTIATSAKVNEGCGVDGECGVSAWKWAGLRQDWVYSRF